MTLMKKNTKNKKEIKKFSYSIKIADFYYKKSASDMLKRIRKETGVKKIKKLYPFRKQNLELFWDLLMI